MSESYPDSDQLVQNEHVVEPYSPSPQSVRTQQFQSKRYREFTLRFYRFNIISNLRETRMKLH
jgi:hypothetical protein